MKKIVDYFRRSRHVLLLCGNQAEDRKAGGQGPKEGETISSLRNQLSELKRELKKVEDDYLEADRLKMEAETEVKRLREMWNSLKDEGQVPRTNTPAASGSSGTTGSGVTSVMIADAYNDALKLSSSEENRENFRTKLGLATDAIHWCKGWVAIVSGDTDRSGYYIIPDPLTASRFNVDRMSKLFSGMEDEGRPLDSFFVEHPAWGPSDCIDKTDFNIEQFDQVTWATIIKGKARLRQ